MNGFPDHPFAERRRRALAALGERGALVLPAAPEVVLGRDTELPYVPDPNLFYLTGCVAPESVAVLVSGSFFLFASARDAERERWTGSREAPEALGERLGADAAWPIAELADRLPRLLARVDTVHFPLAWGRPRVERVVLDILADARRGRQRRGQGPRALVDPGAVLDSMRLVKDQAELARLRSAAAVTVDAFREAARELRDGIGEWQVQAALEYGFRRRGARGPAFPSIVAAGANATVLHYTANSARLTAGELLLVDAGATVDMYHADVTRTWSIERRPTDEQRDLHAIVMRAHAAAIEAVRPGATEADVHRAALAELLQGMSDLHLLDETPDAILAAEDERARARPSEAAPEDPASAAGDATSGTARPAFARFFPHRVSHWLGLEVHDVGDYAIDGEPLRLRPGMVLTVEPGLYIAGDDERAPAALRGVGVRIEDDVLVTAEGHEVLTAELSTALESE